MTINDIIRLNHIKYTACRELVRDPMPLWECLALYLLRIPYMLLKKRFGSIEIKDVLFIAPTINNRKSLNPIVESLPNDKYTVWDDFLKSISFFRIYIHSCRYLPLFFKLYHSSTEEDRALIRFYYLDFLLACSTYQEVKRILENNRQIKLIVFANDHILVNRCVIELSVEFGIKTLYVQHASVTNAFPPLIFDYSFLDGLESYEKYQEVGNMRGRIFLSGSPRFDAFHKYKKETSYDIGIALNELDSEDLALKLCFFLKEHYSSRIIVRPHPEMLRPECLLFHKEKFISNGIAYSNPLKDLSYVFISSIKTLIANESGIHLDAALMNTPSILYNFSKNAVMDWYGYIKNGLVNQCDSFEDIVEQLGTDFQIPEEVVRYYAASFHRPIEGNVGVVIAEFAKKIVLESESSAFRYIEQYMEFKESFASYRN